MGQDNKQIHDKGFNLYDYSRIKVGVKELDDAVLNLGTLKSIEKQYSNKKVVLQALASKNVDELRAISDYYYSTNGIYNRMCNHFAYLYRYDWYIDPQIKPGITPSTTELLRAFHAILDFLDNSYIKKLCGDIALDVIRYGAYYGYIVPTSKGITL